MKLIRSAPLTGGGTVAGDLKIEGDLEVEGGGSLTVDAATSGNVSIVDTTASSATEGGNLILGSNDGAVMASGHRLGVLSFAGAEDTSSTLTTGARIEALADATWSASENGADLLFYTTDGNASQSEQVRITAAGNVGIGIASPDGAGLHIHSATAGSVAAHANADELVVEGSGATGISILTADAQTGAIMFGCPSDNQAARITNTQSTGVFTVGAAQTGGVLHLEAGAGTTRMIIDDNSRLSLSNNDLGTSNTVFGKLAGDDLASGGNYNVFIGENAGHENSVGDRNIAIGFNAYDDGHTLANLDNIFIGYGSGGGTWATAASTGNTAIGSGSMTGAQNGALNNTVIGYGAGNVISTGDGNTVFGKDAGLLLTSGANNVMIGISAGDATVDSSNHVIIGTGAGGNGDIAADGVIAIGYAALHSLTAGERNLAIGTSAADAIAGTDDTIAIGYEALTALATDNAARNMAIGNYTLKALNADGRDNIAIGFEALETANHADIDGNIAIGNYVLDDVGTTGVWGCTGIGTNALTAVNHADAAGSTAIGYYALAALTEGVGNVAVGKSALVGLTTGDSNIAIGTNAADAMVGTESGNIAIGADAMGAADEDNESIDNNIAIGTNALKGGDLASTAFDVTNNVAIGNNVMDGTGTIGATFNVFVGDGSGGGAWATAASNYNVGVGAATFGGAMNGALNNVAVGYQALISLTEGVSNVAIGKDAGEFITTASGSCFIGKQAGQGITSAKLTGDNNTAIGKETGLLLQGAAHSNTLVGATAGNAITTGTGNTLIGHAAGLVANTAANNVMIGAAAGDATLDSNNHVIVGVGAGGNGDIVSDGVVAVGYLALHGNTSGNGNTAVGYQAGTAIVSGSNNTAVGYEALFAEDLGKSSTAIGFRACYYQNSNTTDEIPGNTAVGYAALYTNVDGQFNTAIGFESLFTFEADTDNHGDNTALGYRAGKFVSTGTGQTFIGMNAGVGITGTPLTGDNNTAVGRQAGLELEGAAHSNTFVGTNAGSTTEAGVENTCIGNMCLAEDDTATNQIVIGNRVTGTADNAVHIGNDTSHIRCDFNSDQTWDASSDRRQKRDIEPSELGLAFINDLNPVKYKHKSPSEFPEEWTAYDADDTTPMGGNDKYKYGFIAQEVKEVVDKYNAPDYNAWSVEPDGRQRISREAMIVTLVKAVQELSAQVEELKNK